MGDVNHAFNIIEEFSSMTRDFKEFTFAFKLQFRNLDTFIHPDYLKRNDLHYIKRFQDTKLKIEDFKKIIKKIREKNHKVVIGSLRPNTTYYCCVRAVTTSSRSSQVCAYQSTPEYGSYIYN